MLIDDCWLSNFTWYPSLSIPVSSRGNVYYLVISRISFHSRSVVHTWLFSVFAYNPFHFRTNSLFCFLLSCSFTSALIFVLFPLLLWDFKNYYYFLFKKYLFFTHMRVLPVCVYVHRMCPWSLRRSEQCWILEKSNCRWLWDTMWLLGTGLRPSVRAAESSLRPPIILFLMVCIRVGCWKVWTLEPGAHGGGQKEAVKSPGARLARRCEAPDIDPHQEQYVLSTAELHCGFIWPCSGSSLGWEVRL